MLALENDAMHAGEVYADVVHGVETAEDPLALPITSVALTYRGRQWVKSKMLWSERD